MKKGKQILAAQEWLWAAGLLIPEGPIHASYEARDAEGLYLKVYLDEGHPRLAYFPEKAPNGVRLVGEVAPRAEIQRANRGV